MLPFATQFPHVGSVCYFDDQAADGGEIVKRARIQRDNGDGTALLSIDSHRFRHEVASGNRTVPFEQLREFEQAAPIAADIVVAAKSRRRRGL